MTRALAITVALLLHACGPVRTERRIAGLKDFSACESWCAPDKVRFWFEGDWLFKSECRCAVGGQP